MITSYFFGDKIVSSSSEAFSLYEKSRFGEKNGKKVEYSGVEALYLVENEKMKVFFGEKEIGTDELLIKLKRRDKKIDMKFSVFSDLRKKGYIAKTALKFGAEFRVYDKGVKPGEEHAEWLLISVKENEQMKWHEFAAKSRVAHSTRKKLLLGVVDEEGDVTYYEVGWKRL